MDDHPPRGDDRRPHRPDAAAGGDGAAAPAATRVLADDPGTDALAALGAVAQRSQQRERAASAKELAAARAVRRAKRTRVAAFVVLGAALVLSVAAVVISVIASTTRTEAVAAALAEPVARQVLASARAETARGARADLDEGNARLAGRGLPVYAQPPPDAPSYVVQRQAARAWALSDYPEDLAERVRDEVAAGRRPATTPVILPIPDLGDIVVTEVPEDGTPGSTSPGSSSLSSGSAGSSSGTPPGLATPPRTSSSRPPPTVGAPTAANPRPPAPTTTTPAPARRGLFPLLPNLPLPVPLLSR